MHVDPEVKPEVTVTDTDPLVPTRVPPVWRVLVLHRASPEAQ